MDDDNRRAISNSVSTKVFRYLILISAFASFLIKSILMAATGTPQPLPFNPDEKPIQALVLGIPIERPLTGGETHLYQIHLDTGKFLHLIVEPFGIDLVVQVCDPEGKKALEFNDEKNISGKKSVKLISELSGIYQIEIHSSQIQAPPGRYQIQIEQLHNAIPKDSTSVTAEKLFAEGKQFEKKGDGASLKSAIEKYKIALEQWQMISDTMNICQVLDKLGFIHFRMSEYKRSNEYYYQLLHWVPKIGTQEPESQSLYGLGRNFVSLGDYIRALGYYEQALEIVKKLNDRSSHASILDGMGHAYTNLGEHKKAIGVIEEGLEIRREINDPEPIANSLNSLARVYDRFGENQKALDCYYESLKICQEIGSRDGEKTILANIGNIYFRFRQYERALENYEQTLAISKEIGSGLGEAYGLKAVADIHYKMDNKIQALEYYKKSLDLCRRLGIRVGESANIAQIAVVYADLDSTDSALEYSNQALVIKRAIKDVQGEVFVLNNIAKLLGKKGDLESARDFSEKALALAQALENPILLGNTYQNLSQLQRQLGNYGQAKEYIDLAIEKVEATRSSVISQDLRASFFSDARKSYEDLISLLYELHPQYPDSSYDRLAFQASEKARCRSFLEMLAEGQIDLRAGIDQELVLREDKIQQQLNDKEKTRMNLKKQAAPEVEIITVEKEINTLLHEFETIQTEIRVANPLYAELFHPQPLSVPEIQEQVLDENTALLEYTLGDDQSYLWLVTKKELKSYILPKRVEIEAVARQVYQHLIARNERLLNETKKQKQARIGQSEKELTKAMLQLSQMILAPVLDDLNKDRLIIVSEGVLQYIPFGALPKPGNYAELEPKKLTPFLADHELNYLPSASVLQLLRQGARVRKAPEQLIAVFADPVYSFDDSRIKKAELLAAHDPQAKIGSETTDLQELRLLRSMAQSGLGNTRSDLSRLPFSRQEGNAIIALARSQSYLCAFDFEANVPAATSDALKNYRIIHFAAHGFLNSVHPELSGIALSMVDKQGKPQNGFLSLHNIYRLKLNADLVVLSACQTALGKDIRGEGLVGLTRGFMYAGAPRVVASLWKVDDEATAELMKRFYKFMLGEEQLPAAAALRQAQLSIMTEKRWQSPYYWAGFVLQGDWQ